MLTAGCAILRPPWRNRADLLAAREWTRQAAGCMQRQEWSEAERHLARAIEACPVDDEARHCYAQVLWHEGRLQEAVGQMEQAIRLASTVDPGRLVELGTMYLELDDLAAAERQAGQALEREPQLASAWRLKGDVFGRSGDTARALKAYQRALSLAPDDHHSRLAMARIYLAGGEPLRAVSSLSQLEGQQGRLDDPGEFWELYGLSLLAVDRSDEAVAALVQALQLRRPSAALLGALVQAYGRSGQPQQAQRTAELARQILPPQQWPQFSSVLPPGDEPLGRVASRPH